jgi:glycosyltransferase involved in cell wall biosynthesis
MVQALRRQRQQAYLYADEIDPELQHLGEPVARYVAEASARADDVLIYHHCVAWRRGVELYTRTRNRRVLKYHNVTPAGFYEGIHPDYVASCAEGAAQTKELAGIPAALYLGDSGYNVRELVRLGAERARAHTLPPFHRLNTLKRLQADEGVLEYAKDGLRNILFVGRVAPNKGHLSLLAVFAYYHRYLNPHSRVFIVGDLDPRLETYVRRVRDAIDRAGLRGFVFLTGKVSPTQLKAYYLVAHAFACASHHEGFCVPLVEAMGFKIPCVAWAKAAVPRTLGRTALVWNDLDPAVMAESLHSCLEHAEIGDHLVRRQYARYRRLFSQAAVRRRFLQILRPLLARVPA